MKHFIYFSSKAKTSGGAIDLSNLMGSGRLDIAIHSIIAGLFLSHAKRDDIKFHLIFYGMPDPPKHIEITDNKELHLSKKDVGTLIKKTLYKYKEGKKNEPMPGVFVEKKSFLKVVEELEKEKVEVFILDKKGDDIRKVKIPENCAFIVGDHDGLPKKELKRLKQIATPVSIGPKMYFASQVVAIVNNELDRRGI